MLGYSCRSVGLARQHDEVYPANTCAGSAHATMAGPACLEPAGCKHTRYYPRTTVLTAPRVHHCWVGLALGHQLHAGTLWHNAGTLRLAFVPARAWTALCRIHV